MAEVWYRYFDHASGSEREIVLAEYAVVRQTEKTVLLQDGHHFRERRVSKTAHKRFAYPTTELAMASFIQRKKWQIKHLNRQLNGARAVLELANLGKFRPEFHQFDFDEL